MQSYATRRTGEYQPLFRHRSYSDAEDERRITCPTLGDLSGNHADKIRLASSIHPGRPSRFHPDRFTPERPGFQPSASPDSSRSWRATRSRNEDSDWPPDGPQAWTCRTLAIEVRVHHEVGTVRVPESEGADSAVVVRRTASTMSWPNIVDIPLDGIIALGKRVDAAPQQERCRSPPP